MNTKLSTEEINALIAYHCYQIIHVDNTRRNLEYHSTRLRQLARFYEIETTATETK